MESIEQTTAKGGDQPEIQESSVPDRYKSILEENTALGEAAKDARIDQPLKEESNDNNEDADQPKEESKEITKEEKPDDKKKEEDDEEIIYENDKITFKKGEDSRELVRVSFKDDKGDDVFGYMPEGVKQGFLKNSDYTQKTQQLKKDREQFEADKKQLEVLEYVDLLGRLPEERPKVPRLNEDFLNAKVKDRDGSEDFKYESEEAAHKAYDEAIRKYNQDIADYDKIMTDKRLLDDTRKSNRAKNTEMINSFRDKYGDEAAKQTLEAAGKYINAGVFRELQPYESNALEVLYFGLNHEKLKEEAVKQAKIDALKGIDEKKTSKVLKGRQLETKITKNENMPDRYAFLDET